MVNGRRVGPPDASVVETEIDDEIALFLPATQHAAVLNGTASDIWRLCDGEHTLEEIVSLLGAAYDVEPDRLRQDVEAAIEDFRRSGFLAEEAP